MQTKCLIVLNCSALSSIVSLPRNIHSICIVSSEGWIPPQNLSCAVAVSVRVCDKCCCVSVIPHLVSSSHARYSPPATEVTRPGLDQSPGNYVSSKCGRKEAFWEKQLKELKLCNLPNWWIAKLPNIPPWNLNYEHDVKQTCVGRVNKVNLLPPLQIWTNTEPIT